MTPPLLLRAALFAALGLALGIAHFEGLRRTTGIYLERGLRGLRGRAVALHVARLLGTAAVFILISKAGAAALLAAFGGFLAARLVTVARARRRGP